MYSRALLLSLAASLAMFPMLWLKAQTTVTYESAPLIYNRATLTPQPLDELTAAMTDFVYPFVQFYGRGEAVVFTDDGEVNPVEHFNLRPQIRNEILRVYPEGEQVVVTSNYRTRLDPSPEGGVRTDLTRGRLFWQTRAVLTDVTPGANRVNYAVIIADNSLATLELDPMHMRRLFLAEEEPKVTIIGRVIGTTSTTRSVLPRPEAQIETSLARTSIQQSVLAHHILVRPDQVIFSAGGESIVYNVGGTSGMDAGVDFADLASRIARPITRQRPSQAVPLTERAALAPLLLSSAQGRDWDTVFEALDHGTPPATREDANHYNVFSFLAMDTSLSDAQRAQYIEQAAAFGVPPDRASLSILTGSDRGNSPLSIIELLRAGVDPNTARRSASPPLHRAAQANQALNVAALLAGGADPERAHSTLLSNQDRATAHAVAMSAGSKEAAATIEAFGRAGPQASQTTQSTIAPREGVRESKVVPTEGLIPEPKGILDLGGVERRGELVPDEIFGDLPVGTGMEEGVEADQADTSGSRATGMGNGAQADTVPNPPSQGTQIFNGEAWVPMEATTSAIGGLLRVQLTLGNSPVSVTQGRIDIHVADTRNDPDNFRLFPKPNGALPLERKSPTSADIPSNLQIPTYRTASNGGVRVRAEVDPGIYVFSHGTDFHLIKVE